MAPIKPQIVLTKSSQGQNRVKRWFSIGVSSSI